MTRSSLWAVLAAAAALTLLLPPPISAAADGTPAEAGNVLFTIPEGWQRTDQGGVAILTPPGVPAGKMASLRIPPGEELTTDLRAWFDAHWETEKHGATVVDGGEVQAQRVPAGYDTVLTYGELQDKAGKHIYIFFLAAQAKTRAESYCFTTDSLEVLQQCGAGLTAFAKSLMFKNLQPASAAPVAEPSPTAPATPAAPSGPEATVTLSPPTSQQELLWRSLTDLRPHRLSEEFDELTAGSSIPLITFSQSPVTLKQAIANARARLNRDASAAAIAGLRSSPVASSVRSLQAAAVAAVVAGKPAAALAALLTAYDKEPRNPSVLVNLAALLARLGMPSEALAFLDAADKPGASFPAPEGLKGQAIALNNRGYALLLLARWKEAEVVLRKAVALEPQLTEAARNLAYVLSQEDEKEEARKFFLLSVWRVRPQKLVCGGATSKPDDAPSDPFALKGTESLPSLGEMFDLSSGAPGRLPMLRHPTDVAQMDAFEKMVEKYRTLVRDRFETRHRRLDEISAQLAQRPKSLTEKRSRDILGTSSLVGCQPDVRALYRQQCDDSEALRVKVLELDKGLRAQVEANQKAFTAQWKREVGQGQSVG